MDSSLLKLRRNQATVPFIDRLDDGETNPFTGALRPEGYLAKLKGRRALPVSEQREQWLATYHNHSVFVLSSDTGSGKSTLVAATLMIDEWASGMRIACTQPRRVAATELATHVADELGVVLGEEVGYHIGGVKKMDKDANKPTRVSYMTEGILVRQLALDNNLSRYACVIVDEAHERNVETDFLIAMLKKILARRKDFKVIIMSATLDAKLFQGYFNDCPLVHISGRRFEVGILYTQPHQATSDYSILAANTVLHIHRNKGPGDILVFLPGQGEIREVCFKVRQYAKDLDIFPFYSGLPAREQARALGKFDKGKNRRCIVSTNIAEASITIPGVVYVVDTGVCRQSMYNPRLGIDMLQVRPISQASANQRAGRAGRTRSGFCYRLYSKKDFGLMPLSNEPAIRTSSGHSTILRLLAAGVTKVANFDWLDAPHPETLARVAEDFQDWGFLNEDGSLTKSGRTASIFPLEPIWYQAIEVGSKFGCSMDIVDIAVIFNNQKSIMSRASGYEQVADEFRAAFACGPSDHLAHANAFNHYQRAVKKSEECAEFDLERWCTKHHLDSAVLEDVLRTRQQVGRLLVGKINPSRASKVNQVIIYKALATAFSSRAAIYHAPADAYRTVHGNLTARLDPNSCLINGRFEWVVYTSLDKTGSNVMIGNATAINAEWLVDLPFFQDDRLPKKFDGSDFRQVKVNQSLDAARARIAASKE